MFVSFINVFSRVRKVTRESTRFNNKNSEPEAEVRLLSFQNKIKIFQGGMLSKTYCYFRNVRMRTNSFRKKAVADHEVEE